MLVHEEWKSVDTYLLGYITFSSISFIMSLINTADNLLNNTHVVNLNPCIQNKLGHSCFGAFFLVHRKLLAGLD